jgi:nitrate/TMAO reductase-like tetraheme cytochrome c subunit
VIDALLSAAAQVTDSAAALRQAHTAPTDSVAVESPLPGGVAQLTRFLLNTVPTWVQIGGLVLIAIVVVVGLVFLIRRRQAIRTWLATREPAVRVALLTAAVALLALAGGLGAATWNYTQHANEFCVGCHVMNPAFQKFGDEENAHAELSCHACHQQGIGASARQLYLWVKERPEEIGDHAKVPNQICAECHVTGDTAIWQRIAATAGHRVHLESDSSTLEGLQCVTCHGVEVHQFQPVRETCGQSECHKPTETDIVLGEMATQTVQHCTVCHEFTADVPALATRDSARGTLVPGMQQCLGCHEMRQVMADFDPERDPHGATCGMCHNPHEQETPAAAAATCATAGCHSSWREEPFHVGEAHGRVGSQCLTCHEPHRAKVDASECAACHRAVQNRGRLQPPLPFDTSAAMRPVGFVPTPRALPHSRGDGAAVGIRAPLHAAQSSPIGRLTSGRRARGEAAPSGGVVFLAALDRTDALPGPEPSGGHVERPPAAAADTFSHARHARLACLVCHATGTGHGRLTFERPRGCAICHHQSPATARCASCHRESEYAAQRETLTVTVPGHPPVARPVDFLHAAHETPTCVTCHTTPVTLAPPPAKAQCRDCHTDHHAVDRTCSACHIIAEPKAAHTTLEVAHQRCDACHTGTTVARLTPTRSFCSTCHAAKEKDHYDQRECTVCHFLAEPATYRAKIMTAPPG